MGKWRGYDVAMTGLGLDGVDQRGTWGTGEGFILIVAANGGGPLIGWLFNV